MGTTCIPQKRDHEAPVDFRMQKSQTSTRPASPASPSHDSRKPQDPRNDILHSRTIRNHIDEHKLEAYRKELAALANKRGQGRRIEEDMLNYKLTKLESNIRNLENVIRKRNESIES